MRRLIAAIWLVATLIALLLMGVAGAAILLVALTGLAVILMLSAPVPEEPPPSPPAEPLSTRPDATDIIEAFADPESTLTVDLTRLPYVPAAATHAIEAACRAAGTRGCRTRVWALSQLPEVAPPTAV